MKKLVLNCRVGGEYSIGVEGPDSAGHIEISDLLEYGFIYLNLEDVVKIARHVGLDVADPAKTWTALAPSTVFRFMDDDRQYEVVALNDRTAYVDHENMATYQNTTLYRNRTRDVVVVVE